MPKSPVDASLRKRAKSKNAKNKTDDDVLEKIAATKPPTSLINSLFLDFAAIVLVVSLTFAKLFYRIEEPAKIVWDETHFTKFSTWYITGHYFVDIHPPLAKLIMAFTIWLSGYQPLEEPGVQWWTENGFVGTQDYVNIYNSPTYIYVRMGSLIMGCLLVASTYITMRLIGCKRISALFTTWMVMTDHLITIDSRIILTDIYLWMFHMTTIGCSFASTRTKSITKSYLLCALTGFLLGCTVSVKYTAFGTIGIVGMHQATFVFHSLYQTIRRNLRLNPTNRISSFLIFFHYVSLAIFKACLILGIAFAVFVSIWLVHLHYLPYSGQGDGFMDTTFTQSLIPYFTEAEKAEAALGGCPNHANSWYDCGFPTITPQQCEERGCCWDPTSTSKWCYPKFAPPVPAPKRLSYWTSIAYMLEATWKNNQGEALNYHPQISRWWQWPLLTCKFVDFGFGMYSMGNPAVWWLVALVAAITFVCVIASIPIQISDVLIPPKNADNTIRYAGGLSGWACFLTLIVGYIGNWAPFYFIERSTWNYHYMLALLIGIILCGFSFDYLIRYYEKKNRTTYLLILVTMTILAILMGVAFWYWSPWVYGFKLSPPEKEALRWHELWGV